jgi:hypothetical protein
MLLSNHNTYYNLNQLAAIKVDSDTSLLIIFTNGSAIKVTKSQDDILSLKLKLINEYKLLNLHTSEYILPRLITSFKLENDTLIIKLSGMEFKVKKEDANTEALYYKLIELLSGNKINKKVNNNESKNITK